MPIEPVEPNIATFFKISPQKNRATRGVHRDAEKAFPPPLSAAQPGTTFFFFCFLFHPVSYQREQLYILDVNKHRRRNK